MSPAKSTPATLPRSLSAALVEREQAGRQAALLLVRDHVARQVNGTQSFDDAEAAELLDALQTLGVTIATFDGLVETAKRVSVLENETADSDSKEAAWSAQLQELTRRETEAKNTLADVRRKRVLTENLQRAHGSMRAELSRLRAGNPLLFADPGDALAPKTPGVGIVGAQFIRSGAGDPFRQQAAS